jgi:hypothetical protein
VLLLLVLVGGCAAPPPAMGPDLPAGDAPGATEVRQAVARLHDGLATQDGWPPEHLTRSRDFPELPLVTVGEVIDEAAWGVDAATLQRTLEKAVRDGYLLRLASDEEAVPDWLRDAEGQAPPQPTLRLRAWAGKGGEFHLRLEDVGKETQVLEVKSD